MRHLSLSNFPFGRETARFLEPFNFQDWTEKDGVFSLGVDMPGVKKEDIKVTTDQGMVFIKANRKIETRHGFMEKSYTHSFYLPEGGDVDSLDATYASGVLTLTLKGGKNSTNKEITVK